MKRIIREEIVKLKNGDYLTRASIISMAFIFTLIALIPFFTVIDTSTAERRDHCLLNSSFYMYGQSTCPYCLRLKEFLGDIYPDNFDFCFIDHSGDCRSRFEDLINKMITEWGLRGEYIGVPLTLVVKTINETRGIYMANGGVVTALVIGAVTDKTFWYQLACIERSDVLYIYYGNRLLKVIGEDKTPVETSQRISRELLLIPIVVVVVAAAITIYSYISKRRK